MVKKDIKYPYFDEDFLFLMLELIDFPRGAKDTFRFEEIRNKKHTKNKISDIIKYLVFLKNEFGDIYFDNYFFDLFTPKNVNEIIDQTLDTGNVINLDLPEWDKDKLSSKFIREKFDMDDLELVANLETNTSEAFFNLVRFDIKLEKSFRSKIEKVIREYINLFEQDKLDGANTKINYYTPQNHQPNGLKLIKRMVDDSKKKIWLKTSDFGEKYHFLEFMLSLYFSKHLEITDISFENGMLIAKVIIKQKLINREKINHNKTQRKNKKITILSLPAGIFWENITMKFVNIYDIDIFIKDKLFRKITNEDLACFDAKTKDKNPDVQWKFFQKLSTMNGEFRISTDPEKDKHKQMKKILSERLQKMFGINDDPFSYISENGIYQTKFKLMPEPDIRGNGEVFGIRDEKVFR